MISMHLAHQGLCTREMQTFASNATQRLLLIAMPDTLSSQLRGVCPPRRNLHIPRCIHHNLPPPANKECSEASNAKHSTGTGTRHGDPSQGARPANDLHACTQVHLSTRTAPPPGDCQAKHKSPCARSTSTYQLLISRPLSPLRPALSRRQWL